MPKKGHILCIDCGKVFNGILPDSTNPNFIYLSVDNEIDQQLVEELQKHHLETARIYTPDGTGIKGHDKFKVFLESGQIGIIEANSYFVSYTESGKERE